MRDKNKRGRDGRIVSIIASIILLAVFFAAIYLAIGYMIAAVGHGAAVVIP